MVTPFVTELKADISDPRLERYRRPLGATDLDMVTNYYWNMELADALHCSLGTVEVLLRNSLHNTLNQFFGRPDWYDGTGLLEERQQVQRDEARHHIESRKRAVTPERMVSQLTFGFWVTLLSANYNDRFWRPVKGMNLKITFPHAPPKLRRSDIQAKYFRVNNLRNLAFHHEPIFDLASLLDDHRRAYEAIAWIDPTLVPKTRLFDRFPAVHQNGRAAVEATLTHYLGSP